MYSGYDFHLFNPFAEIENKGIATQNSPKERLQHEYPTLNGNGVGPSHVSISQPRRQPLRSPRNPACVYADKQERYTCRSNCANLYTNYESMTPHVFVNIVTDFRMGWSGATPALSGVGTCKTGAFFGGSALLVRFQVFPEVSSCRWG